MALTKNKIRYGFSKVVYFPITETLSGVTYGTAKNWPGAKSLTLSPEGSTQVTYADNVAYYSTTKNNGYSGTITMLDSDYDFKKDILKYIEIGEGHLVEDANAMPAAFGMVCQFEGDSAASAFQFFKVVPGRLGLEANTTEEDISPDTCALNVTILPVVNGDNAFLKAEILSSAAAYSKAFTTMALPTLPAGK